MLTSVYRGVACCLLPIALFGQNRIGTGEVQELFNQHCASCHGENLEGGQASSLLVGDWQQINEQLTFMDYVRNGNLEMGMPPFGSLLSDAQVRSLEIYIQEMRQKKEREGQALVSVAEGVYSAGGYRFRVETMVDALALPWSVAFLPDGGLLITERAGALRVARAGVLSEPISGTPKVWSHGQGGLMEVALHPDYEDNGWIYLGIAASGGERDGKAQGMTKILRGRIRDGMWVDEQVIFEVPFEYHRSAGVHFGTRLVFKDGYLFFGIGDRGAMEMAQDLTRPNGKIHRVHDDGRIPSDNPFADSEGAYPSTWAYGNRNPQGLDLHPQTGALWESEHGPRGGDEINCIERGRNYGWPVITHGMNYNGKPISAMTAKEGMEQPAHYWTPSIAVCGIDFYEGDLFPNWKYDLFAGGLASQELHRLVIEAGEVISDEIILNDLGRVRDVASGLDGALYVVLNGPDRIVRLVPID
ncbi:MULTISPECIES: PQQ-dependent sugar dehydrogenase [unclassified Lentimonas]|uniref:PQQ-dependent sugar dehydrogenase n=1 Tax=unclassified Lentimonas TaxID=2630993 RepID=UPI00132A5B6B|nr:MULTISPECIES: PQQ-dependent sugar dehydrogenase [unclassified Lentimonas]CAA6690577.1 PQQ-dependent oxidoreductase, gdhB family [Lentimonas sp. CC10]CAA6695316.1 PQQ-dependent oxidoreductase, gdhB family [Lentimonas sp. CC19]CAA7068834.1 PQQ-dependent oxidoreductase, gdhB family [Lentimonas sp. CC11]